MARSGQACGNMVAITLAALPPVISHLLAEFLQTSLLEWAGFITTVINVYLAAKQNIWNWPTGLASVAIYMVVFFKSQLFGDAGLQVYFFATGVYGWYFWLTKKQQAPKPVVNLSFSQQLAVAAGIAAGTGLLGWFLKQYTSSNVPYIDGFCTAISFAAQLLMTRKVLQNWALWVFVDICYIPLYIYKNLYLTSVLYLVLLVLSWQGHVAWQRDYRRQLALKHE